MRPNSADPAAVTIGVSLKMWLGPAFSRVALHSRRARSASCAGSETKGQRGMVTSTGP
jgi:hypothetical protein